MTNEKFTRPLMHRIVITYHRPGLQESIRMRFTGRSARSVTREKRRGEQTRQAFVRQDPEHSCVEEPEETQEHADYEKSTNTHYSYVS